MSRYIRDYEIQILSPDNELITILPPISMHCNIIRNTLASVNKCSLTIYNLSAATRNRIFKDRYTIVEYWQLVIKAGYFYKGSKRIETIFQGNIYESLSYKDKTEWVTKIDGFDGLHAIQNGFTSGTFEANTPDKTIVKKIIKDMPELIEGVLGSPTDGKGSKRGKVLFGQSIQVLAEQVENQFWIDNEVVNILDSEEYLTEQVLLLDSDEMLITPKRRDTFLDCEKLFLPEAKVGLLCEIRSLAPIYNGQYKTMGFTHDITISGAECGTAKTMISLYAGAAGLRAVAI